jgi:hypothetical protein
VAFPAHLPAMGPWAMADVASRRKLAKSFMKWLDSF